ncbi:MAG TPA: zinc-binding dehydrogenase [Burkholderiales bacterium]|jgi:propanol-preferring alcohol dehydrogenase|nr:zinc-binding dehydrogenase [Burkholderiales bacterium]
MILKAPRAPFELVDVPDPVAGPGEAVAKVLACGSGLTIQHIKAGRIAAKFPRIIGHEIAGEIVEVGKGAAGLRAGDPVTAYYYLSCGHCRWCLAGFEPLCENSGGNVGRDCDGGYAQYIKLPAHIFLRLPEGLDYRARPAEVGVMNDAIATPYKVLRRARVKAGETVAVFGAGGGVGIHQVMLARWARARVIAVDIARSKFEACRKAGADAVVDASTADVAEALLDLTRGNGVDVVIDYVSTTATLEAGAKALGRHGRLVTLGGAGQRFQASSLEMLLKEQDLLGSRYVSRAEVLEALDLCARGEVWPIVTEIRRLKEAEAVHAMVERGEVVGRAALLIDA